MPPSLSPPHIIIIPAACQTPEFYTPLTNALAGLSLPHSTVLSLPSTDPAQISSLPDFSADVSTIRSAIVSILDNDDSEKGGDDVVLVMHSYGGVPGSAAVKGLGKAQREKEGKTRGVVRVIYVCSFVLDEGESMPGAGDVEKLKAMAGEGFDEVKMTITISPQAAIMGQFHDVPSSAEAKHWAGLMKTHSVRALWSPQTYAAYMDIPSAYVFCTLDRIMSLQKQEEMVANARAKQPKAFDVVERLESGHEPILSLTPQLADVVKKIIETKGW